MTHLKTVLSDSSKGRYDRDKAVEIRGAARRSIGSRMPAKSLELKHTIWLIQVLDAEIEEVESEIAAIMDSMHSPITTIPGISYRMGAMILAEIGDFSRFDSPDKILASKGTSFPENRNMKHRLPHLPEETAIQRRILMQLL